MKSDGRENEGEEDLPMKSFCTLGCMLGLGAWAGPRKVWRKMGKVLPSSLQQMWGWMEK